MDFMIAAYTDAGMQKKANEDSLCIRRATLPVGGEMVLAVVCDGMGGLQKGELASAECVRTFGAWFDQELERLPTRSRGHFEAVKYQWTELFQSIHNRLLSYAVTHRVQLGTTAAVFFACGDRYLAANIGDSRAYLRGDSLRQLTQDHSLVAQEIAIGRITEEDARQHPQRNILLQCLGTGDTVDPFFAEGSIQNGNLFFLCTDGYVHEVSSKEISDHLTPTRLNSKEAMTNELAVLAEVCKHRGETDNMAAVLIKATESTLPERSGRIRRIFTFGRNKKTCQVQNTVLVETAEIVHTTETID